MPIEMHIAEEMAKELKMKHNPPNLVAKLMGLDALPCEKHDSASKVCHSKGYGRSTWLHSETPSRCWQQDDGCLDKQMNCESGQCQEQTIYNDVYEICPQAQNAKSIRDKSPQKAKYMKDFDEKQIAFLRQKFAEAKHLAADEKLRQSKEFEEALEVLSSNKDFFLQFLQESNSLFPRDLYEFHSVCAPSETNRITVLKPSKIMDGDNFVGLEKKSEKQVKKPVLVGKTDGWNKANHQLSPAISSWKADRQPTRIVVLKPSSVKTPEIKAVVSQPSLSRRILPGKDYFAKPDDCEARQLREVAKETTYQMTENLGWHGKDETSPFSVFSIGCIGYESFFNRAENKYVPESDSEVMSPYSRRSRGFINNFCSPSPSFSHVSNSRVSSVCWDAKKQLSERCTMTTDENPQERKLVPRSSRTLGEMLALSETKKSTRSEENANTEQEQLTGSTPCLTGSLSKDEVEYDYPKSFLGSKSVPESSKAYDTGLNVELSGPEVHRLPVSEELAKAKSTKSSLKSTILNLFLSRNKKSSKAKSNASCTKDEMQASPEGSLALHIKKIAGDTSQCVDGSGNCECLSADLPAFSIGSVDTTRNQSISSLKVGISLTKPVMPGNPSENPDQPSPISVLEPPYEDDDSTNSEILGNVKADRQGMEVFFPQRKSKMIDKSPPIETIARTLPMEDSAAVTAASYPLKPSFISSGLEEERDWYFLVQALLTDAGNPETWHSPNSPLDPLLREKYANSNCKQLMHEANRRRWRSNRKLVFDCVNAALFETTAYALETSLGKDSGNDNQNKIFEGPVLAMVERVWALMKEWISEDDGDNGSLMVEMVTRKEVMGKGWVETMQMKIDDVRKEIEELLLEDLVEDTIVQLTGDIQLGFRHTH